MIDPISLGIGAFSALQGLMDIFGNFKNAQAQYKLLVQQWQDEARERREDYIMQAADLEQRMREVNTQAGADELERKLELQREQARLEVATGEAGISGNLAERLLVDAEQAAGRDIGTIKYNRDAQIGQAVRQGLALQRRARPPKLYAQKPSLGMALLRSGLAIGGGYLSAYQESQRPGGGRSRIVTVPKPKSSSKPKVR